MNKLIKVFISLLVLAGVLFLGLTVFVHFYLTDERVKALIVPQAEKALGRKVHIGRISVGILSGISIENFSVKETDGTTDFISSKKFVLDYKLLPLLSKRLVIGRILFDEPRVRIIRDKKGNFNFDTLPFMAKTASVKKPAAGPGGASPASAAILPLALTVKEIEVKNASMDFEDETGEIPDVKAKADLRLALEMGRDLASMKYRGNVNFSARATYGKLTPVVSGTGNFTPEKLDYSVDIDMDKQKINLAGEVKNYLKTPDIRMDIKSDELDIDRLVAVLGALPASTSKQGKPAAATAAKKSTAPVATSLPNGLKAHGTVKVGKALYNGLKVENFSLRYALENGIFTVDDLKAGVANGQVTGKMRADLTRPDLTYSGKIDVNSVMLEYLLPYLADIPGEMVSGAFDSSITFSGAGTRWPALRNALSADGSFTLKNGKIQKTPLTSALARLLRIREIENLKFDSLNGTLHLARGRLAIKSRMNSRDIGADMNGTVGLDGRLNMPVQLLLSPELMKKMRSSRSIARYLSTDNGWTKVSIRIVGTIQRPRPTLDTRAIKRQIKQEVKKKAIEIIKKLLPHDVEGTGQNGTDSGAGAAEELIKGFFGQ